MHPPVVGIGVQTFLAFHTDLQGNVVLLCHYRKLFYLVHATYREIMMGLFQKNLRPADLGICIYERLRKGMQSNDDHSMANLLSGLEVADCELDEQHVGEIMIGLLFGATLAIEGSASVPAAQQVVSSMKAEFVNHLHEQGATPIQKAEWEAVLADRFLTYRKCLEGYSGFEPPWRLGRAFFWNIIGKELHIAMSVKICTLYMLAAKDMCAELLKELGPRLHMEPQL